MSQNGIVRTRGQYAALALDALRQGAEWWEKEYQKMEKTAPRYEATLSDLERRMESWGFRVEVPRSTKQRALSDLRELGVIGLDGKQYHLTDRIRDQ